MRIAITTDAWEPYISGVVTTLRESIRQLRIMGHEVEVFSVYDVKKTLPCPSYPQIRLAWRPYRQVAPFLDAFKPDVVFAPLEAPVGIAGRKWAKRNKVRFVTAYTTRFPEYIKARYPFVPLGVTYRGLRWFHDAADALLVSTKTLEDELSGRGFSNIQRWPRGVDIELFHPNAEAKIQRDAAVFMYVGRVAKEKNIEAFLKLDLPGEKWVVGGGPSLEEYKKKYPEAHFTGERPHHELPNYLVAADVFVFPSLTDTFGLVMLEAMACGVPVAAFPVQGPINVVRRGKTGILSENLAEAAVQALELSRQDAREQAEEYSWQNVTRLLESHLKGESPSSSRRRAVVEA